MNNQFFIDKFEEEICRYTGAKYCVLTDSCTNAIFLSLSLLNKTAYIPVEANTLYVPKSTYVGVPHSIVNAGFNVEFTDQKWKGSYEIEGTNIIDSAVDFHRGMYRPGFIQCLSFHQKKRLNIGKGGAILTDDADTYERLKMMAFDGRSPIIEMEDWVQGFHMNMSPEMAAQGLLILNQIDLRPDNAGSYRDYKDLSVIKYFKENNE